jgi:hypothetical protein
MSKVGKDNDASRAGDLVAGTTKHFTNPSQELVFGGATQTVAEVTAKLQTIPALRAATTQAQSTAHAKVVTEEAQLPALLAFMTAYAAFLKAMFGNTPDVLADFGLEPKKAPTPLTAAQQAAAVAKRKATRTARGTRGAVQKKAVKGNVTGVVVTPVTAAPEPASPAPANAATPAAPTTPAGGSTPHT